MVTVVWSEHWGYTPLIVENSETLVKPSKTLNQEITGPNNNLVSFFHEVEKDILCDVVQDLKQLHDTYYSCNSNFGLSMGKNNHSWS